DARQGGPVGGPVRGGCGGAGGVVAQAFGRPVGQRAAGPRVGGQHVGKAVDPDVTRRAAVQPGLLRYAHQRRVAAVAAAVDADPRRIRDALDRKSTRLNSSHVKISYAVFCLKKKTKK